MSDTFSPESPVIDDGSGDGSGQKRLLLVVGGAALLLVIGLGVYFLLLSGGEDEEAFVPFPSAAGSQPDDSVDTEKAAKKEKAPTKVNANFTVGRDPFTPLAVEAVEIPAESTTDTTPTDVLTDTGGTGGSTGGGTPAPTASPVPTSAPQPSPSPSPSPSEDTVNSYKVTLVSVNFGKETAVIEVNGKRYSVKVKDMFTNSKSGPFKLTRLGQLPSGKDSATVVFGSDAPVELVIKDTVVFKP